MESMEADLEQRPLYRKQSHYKNLDEIFYIEKEQYRGQQYSQIYFARLHFMRILLYSLIPGWKPQIPVCNVLGLEEGKECILVGTLYKHMKLKPMILDEYSKERSSTPLVKAHNFMNSDDYLVLEDETGRVKLDGSVLLPSVHVTGVVVAIHGKATGADEDKYVVFVSGINAGSTSSNPLMFQLLVDHLAGHLGDEKEQRFGAEIVHVVIAGNSVELPRSSLNGQNLAPKDLSAISDPIKELDIMLTQIAAGVSMDIMPGSNDPANFSLPQQPLNKCLFRGVSSCEAFRSCTNPHFFELDNINFLGTSGQNIEDLDKYSSAKDKLEFMERTLRWRHIAPSSPNTLGCYPFSDRDPFLLESCPHVYFVGNQDRFETRFLKGSEGQIVRLICIPRFCETGIAVALNLRNLDCHALSFDIQFS
ncbi:DNA polymerase delta small subunit-like protein [Drosera capensis]